MPGPITGTMTAIDPHVVNFQGKEFFFYGKHGQCVNMVSSSNFFLNVKLYDTGAHATIITEAAFVIGNDEVGLTKFHLKSVDTTLDYIIVQKYEDGHFRTIACDTEVEFDSGLLDVKGKPVMGKMKVYHDQAIINTGNFIVQSIRCTDPDHNLIGPPHLDLYYDIPENGVLTQGVWPHGILGQSINPEMTQDYEGEENDYQVDHLYSHEFKFDRFGQVKLENKRWFVGASKKSISF